VEILPGLIIGPLSGRNKVLRKERRLARGGTNCIAKVDVGGWENVHPPLYQRRTSEKRLREVTKIRNFFLFAFYRAKSILLLHSLAFLNETL